MNKQRKQLEAFLNKSKFIEAAIEFDYKLRDYILDLRIADINPLDQESYDPDYTYLKELKTALSEALSILRMDIARDKFNGKDVEVRICKIEE